MIKYANAVISADLLNFVTENCILKQSCKFSLIWFTENVLLNKNDI